MRENYYLRANDRGRRLLANSFCASEIDEPRNSIDITRNAGARARRAAATTEEQKQQLTFIIGSSLILFRRAGQKGLQQRRKSVRRFRV